MEFMQTTVMWIHTLISQMQLPMTYHFDHSAVFQTFKLGVQSFLAMGLAPVHVLHMWILLDITNSQVKGLAAKNHETRDPGFRSCRRHQMFTTDLNQQDR